VIAAQMNGSYAAAVALLDGEAFIDQYAEARLSDPRILALIPRIDIRHDAALDRGGAAKRHAVTIVAVLKDGSVLSTTVEQRRGAADRPLSRDEVEMKFRRIAAVALPPSAIEELMGLVEKIECELDVSRLATLLTTTA
jgi:2-methylcitrate dehydratase PrpD